MKNTEDKIQKTMEYSKWLAEQLKELCINQSELAAAVGRTQKTISRYVHGENMPDEATKSAINAFIEERSVYDGFRHIPSKEFSDILSHLLKEFDVSQVELAKQIGKYQRNISDYICKAGKTDTKAGKADTKMQKEILLHFLVCYLPYNTISSVHFGTQVQLNYLLTGHINDWDKDIRFGESIDISPSIEYLLSLPTEIQKLIIDNIYAFSDNSVLDYFYGDNSFGDDSSYYEDYFALYKSCVNLFSRLSDQNKDEIKSELENDAFVGYPENEKEQRFFKLIAAYYNIIEYRARNFEKNQLSDEKERDNYIMEFESAMEDAGTDIESLIDEVQCKLYLPPELLYIWMLFIIYTYKGYDLILLKYTMSQMLLDQQRQK